MSAKLDGGGIFGAGGGNIVPADGRKGAIPSGNGGGGGFETDVGSCGFTAPPLEAPDGGLFATDALAAFAGGSSGLLAIFRGGVRFSLSGRTGDGHLTSSEPPVESAVLSYVSPSGRDLHRPRAGDLDLSADHPLVPVPEVSSGSDSLSSTCNTMAGCASLGFTASMPSLLSVLTAFGSEPAELLAPGPIEALSIVGTPAGLLSSLPSTGL